MKKLIAVIIILSLFGGCSGSAKSKNPLRPTMQDSLATLNSKVGISWKDRYGERLESRIVYNLWLLNQISNAQHNKMVNFAERMREVEGLLGLGGIDPNS